MKTKTIIIILVSAFLTSCMTTIPLSDNYFTSTKKVGIIQLKNEITNYRQGSQGLLDMALTQGNKYQEPLRIIDENIQPFQEIFNTYEAIYKRKGKELIILDGGINFDAWKRFPTNTGASNKKYYKYDLRHLKEKYDIDELLLVDVKYGVLVNYYSFAEIGRYGYCNISSIIVDLSDNSLQYKNASEVSKQVKGKWKTPPKYEKLQNGIDAAIVEAIKMEKMKFW